MSPAMLSGFKGYKKKYIVNDLLAGLMVAVIAMPMSIAVGIQSGVSLQQGLLTSIISGLVLALLSGCKFQIGGPTAAFFAVIFGYVTNPKIGFTGLQMAMLIAGALLIVMGIARLGKFIKLIPYSLVVGFSAGIGIILLVGQFKDFLGLAFPKGNFNFLQKVIEIFKALPSMNVGSLLLGLFTLALVLVLPKIHKKIPASMAALVVSTLASLVIAAFRSDKFGIATLGSTFGNIKAEVHFIDFLSFKNISFVNIIIPSISLAVLIAIESLLTAAVADDMTRTRHDPNMELVGQGAANITCAIFGALPAIGALARTSASINNGAKSPLAGIFHSVFMLIMFVLLMPLLKFVPMCSLAAVIIVVSIKMSNFPLFMRVAKHNWRDTLILIATFLITIFFDLITAVAAGIVISVILFLPHIIRRTRVRRKADANTAEIASTNVSERDADYYENTCSFLGEECDAEYVENTELYFVSSAQNEERKKSATFEIQGALCYKNIVNIINRINVTAADYDCVIIDFKSLSIADVSALVKLVELKKILSEQNKNLEIINAQPSVQQKLERAVKLFSR